MNEGDRTWIGGDHEALGCRPNDTLSRIGLLVVAGVMLAIGGCTDERVVFQREVFRDPPDSVNLFLGYFDAADKMTACGNCHIGQQAEWENTAHADAWATLQASGHAQSFCEGCHSVSELGNPATDPAGYNLVADEQYHDVQCESCHGSGFDHVQNPDAPEKPLAAASVGVDLMTGCGECHSGVHQPFVEEWSASPHANVVSFAAGREECASCHRGQTTLESWGENADYVEKDSPDHLPVTCAVCHDPHDATHPGQLRFPVTTSSIENHLCARCHNRRTVPNESEHGLEPHAPESALLVGDAGWFPPGANIDPGRIRGTHGSAGNPGLCATCHVSRFEVTDQETGEFVFQATGHLFRPIPCVDEQGRPLPFEDECEVSTEARSFTSCTGGGCHFDADAAFSAMTAATIRIQNRVEELESQLLQVDANLDEPGGEIDPTDPSFTVAEGSFFNVELARFGGEQFGTNTVIGSSVHNPFLLEALLIASIQAMENEYGVSPASRASADWQAELDAVLQRVPR